jgi:hypothetical protein
MLMLCSRAHRPPRYLRGPIRARTIPPGQVLVPDRDRRCALDRLHHGCLCPSGAEPGQLADAELRPRRRWHYPHLRALLLGRWRSHVVYWPHRDHRCVGRAGLNLRVRVC